MSKLKVAAVQLRCAPTVEENLRHAEELVREAAAQGAQLVLLPELWERPYFCQQRRYDFYSYALPVEQNPAVKQMVKFWACIAKPIYRMIIFIRKSFILSLVIVALLCSTVGMGASVSVSAGTNGSPRLHAVWR